jgi:hypothetical protein
MPSSELDARSHHARSDWLRALALTVAIPVLVVASVLIGAGASQGAQPAQHRHPQASPAIATKAAVTTAPVPAPTTTTTAPPTTATTGPLPTPATTTPAAQTPPVVQATPSVAAEPSGYGCAAALAYLAAHAAPGFSFECPGYADGNEAMTCVNHAPECSGEHLIVISDPCPAAYMNEAFNSNSWSDATDTFTQGIDPYGSC